jgi:hypothetical protein
MRGCQGQPEVIGCEGRVSVVDYKGENYVVSCKVLLCKRSELGTIETVCASVIEVKARWVRE